MFYILKPDEQLLKCQTSQLERKDLSGLRNDVLQELNGVTDNLVTIITLLPGQYRRVFFLKVVEGLSVTEIALRQKCGILRVYSDLSNALCHIQKNVNHYRILLSPSGGGEGGGAPSLSEGAGEGPKPQKNDTN